MTATSGATASLLPVQAACSTCDRARAGVRARGGVRVGVRVTVRLRVRVRVRVRFRVRVRWRHHREDERGQGQQSKLKVGRRGGQCLGRLTREG